MEILQRRSEAEITVTQKMTVQPDRDGLFLVPITTVSSGEYFGERALEYNDPRSASAKALTKSDLIVITGDTYKSILSAVVKHADLSKQLTFKTVCRRVLTQKHTARTEEDLKMLAEVRIRPVFSPALSKAMSTNVIEFIQMCGVWRKNSISHGGSHFFAILR